MHGFATSECYTFWHCTGCRWLDICEGSADASLLPLLLAIGPKGGTPAEMSMLQSAHQALMRDKNTAFDALEKVRGAKIKALHPLVMVHRHL